MMSQKQKWQKHYEEDEENYTKAQPIKRTVEGSVSGDGFPNTPVVKAVGRIITPKDSPVAGRARSANQTDVAVFFGRNKTNTPSRFMKK